jgi:hypothetical protein
VTEFFKILGEQKVPEEKVPLRLIDIANHDSSATSGMPPRMMAQALGTQPYQEGQMEPI